MNSNGKENKTYKTSEWYQALADHTFPTSFVKLKKEELDALASGEVESEAGKSDFLMFDKER